MFLSKHKNGFYYVYYFNEHGKRLSISTHSKLKSEAYQFLTEFKEKIKQKQRLVLTPITFNQFVFNYLKYSEHINSWNTILSQKSTFNAAKEFFGNIQLTDLTSNKVTEYLHFRLRNGSVYVARRDMAYLSGSFRYAIAQNYLSSNPCKGIFRFKVPEKQPVFFSKEDLGKLLEVIDNEDIKDITLFAVNTGLRQMELISLEWSQINFVDRIVMLDNRKHLTKTRKVRAIPLTHIALNVLQKRRVYNHTRIFTYQGQPMKQLFLSHKFKKYIYRTNINQALNFHSLRHTFCSWLIQKGAPIYQVSRLMGHSSIKTTEIYAHLRRDDLISTIKLLDQQDDDLSRNNKLILE